MVTKSGGTSQTKTGGSAAGKTLSKAPSTSSSDSKGGLFSGLASLFSGSGGKTSSTRPMARPDYLVSGTGDEKRYIDTRTGATYKEPEYGAFSLRGLTSSDPANVARNREAAARYAAMRSSSDRGTGGISSLPGKTDTKPTTPAESEQERKARLAQIGAPTTPMSPVEVATPVYGLPPGMTPAVSYGTAFEGIDPITGFDLGSADIFGSYPDFLTYMTAAGNPNYGMYPGFGLPPMFGSMA